MKITSIPSTAPDRAAQQLSEDHDLIVNPELVAEATGQQSNTIKNFIGILLIFVIIGFLLFARKGALFMFGNLGMIIAIFLALISVIGVIAYLRGWLPSKLKWVVLVLELTNLGFDAYVAGGQWGRASVDAQIVATLNERQNASQQFVAKVNSFLDLNNQLLATAESIQMLEASRDGKGTVYETAVKLTAEFVQRPMVELVYAPIRQQEVAELGTVEEVLTFVVDQQRVLSDQEAKFGEAVNTIQAKAQSFATYVSQVQEQLATNYSQERIANLMTMKSTVDALANYPVPEQPAMVVWTKGDVHGAIGWGDKIVLPLLILTISIMLILVLWFWGGKGADRTNFNPQITLLLAQHKLQQSGLTHSLPENWFPELHEQQMIDLMDNASVLEAMRRTTLSYESLLEAFRQFGQEVFLYLLRHPVWTFGEMRKYTAEYQSFLSEIISRLSPKQWEQVVKYLEQPTEVLQLDDVSLQLFLKMVSEVKLKLRDEEERKEVINHLFTPDGDEDYYQTLLSVGEVTNSYQGFLSLRDRFLRSISGITDEVCLLLGSLPTQQKFYTFVSSWQSSDSNTLRLLKQERLLSSLMPLLKFCLRDSMDLFRAVFEAYDLKQQEASVGMLAKQVVVNSASLGTLLHLADPNDVRQELSKLFVIQ